MPKHEVETTPVPIYKSDSSCRFSMLRCKDAKISQVINNSLRPVTPPQLKNKVKVMSTSSKPDVKVLALIFFLFLRMRGVLLPVLSLVQDISK